MQTNNTPVSQLPPTGFLRLHQIVQCKNSKTQPLIPICRSSFLNGVKSGKYPKPFKLGERTTAWKVEDIKALVERLAAVEYTPTPAIPNRNRKQARHKKTRLTTH